MIKTIKQLIDNRIKTLPTNKICEVVRWDTSTNTGVVRPISYGENINEVSSQLPPFEVVGAVKGEYYKRPLDSGSGMYVTENIGYSTGDRVLVCFIDKDYSNAIVVGRI